MTAMFQHFVPHIIGVAAMSWSKYVDAEHWTSLIKLIDCQYTEGRLCLPLSVIIVVNVYHSSITTYTIVYITRLSDNIV